MSRIKEQYLRFYNNSRKCYEEALEICKNVYKKGECDTECQVCPLQQIKGLYYDIHDTCEYALTKE